MLDQGCVGVQCCDEGHELRFWTGTKLEIENHKVLVRLKKVAVVFSQRANRANLPVAVSCTLIKTRTDTALAQPVLLEVFFL